MIAIFRRNATACRGLAPFFPPSAASIWRSGGSKKVSGTIRFKLEKVIPVMKVTRYIQIENKIRAIGKYELAAQIPLVE